MPTHKYWTITIPPDKVLNFSKFIGQINVELTLYLLLNEKSGRTNLIFESGKIIESE
jgi:hypothetical protein